MIHDRTLSLLRKYGVRPPARIESPILVTVEEAHAANPNTQLGFLTAVNLLSRLTDRLVLEDVPRADVSIRYPIGNSTNLADRAVEVSTSINRSPVDDTPISRILVGGSHGHTSGFITVGNVGWTATAHADGSPVPAPDPELNPLSATLAACFGVSEAFKDLLVDLGATRRYSHRNPEYSLLKFGATVYESERGHYPLNADLGKLSIIGAGALGHAFLYCLSAGGHRGELLLVDDDQIDDTNLNRLVFAQKQAVGFKTDHLASCLQDTGLECDPVHTAYESLGNDVRTKLETVLSLVDSRNNNATRRAIQSDMPRVVYHLATGVETLSFTMLRVDFQEGPCLGCLFPEEPASESTIRSVVTGTGVSRSRAIELLEGQALTPEDLAPIAHHLDKSESELRSLVGRDLYDALAQVCGQTGIESPTTSYNASVGFLSLAAGTVLAARVIADKVGISSASPTTYLQMSPVSPEDQLTPAPVKSDHCSILCQSNVMRSRYGKKWGNQGN